MSFDKETRNLLAKAVTSCRRRLTEDVTDQLAGVFGLHADGTMLTLKEMSHLSPDQVSAAECLRDLLDHYTASDAGREKDRHKSAYERMRLEISFTILNRLAALRLCEERGLVVECVRKGTASDGFRLFERVSGGALGGRYDTYRVFLECLFDELALDLGVLFDRMTPQSSVFPSERCMEDVLDELNKPELRHLWSEDETIGWIYQYFYSDDDREKAGKGKHPPQNSYELAVRNQFFTPRYVVEFLTDNTLGRIWYEMLEGDTVLKEQCRYLVRRSKEVFLSEGEMVPAEPEGRTDLSLDELLKQPVYIEHRSKKDPRDIRILDPACGSGHFLLYAFDLLERIYEEAWEDPDSLKFKSNGRTLHEDFETLDDLRREVPKLIMEHNLHGIDIDPRAAQIAALALWLRAQKTWRNLGIKATERPRVAKSNIVIAEPMPGEEDMKEEFTSSLKPRVLGQFVDEIFEKMKLAGEAGTLLKIEEEIKDIISEAKELWLQSPTPEQQFLFSGMTDPQPRQQKLRFDLKDITDEGFWEQAEDRILDALQAYSEQAENGRAARRRLFAKDAARGFAFIDLCRKRYDVVLMNPPFGEPCTATKKPFTHSYPNQTQDVYCLFVNRGLILAPSGVVGAITSSSFLRYTDYSEYRSTLITTCHLQVLFELGWQVLDGAYVNASAYFLSNQNNRETIFGDVTESTDKNYKIRKVIEALKNGHKDNVVFFMHPMSQFNVLEGSPFCYSLPERFFKWVKGSSKLRSFVEDHGIGAGPHNFFFRLSWEIPPNEIGESRRWPNLTNGGPFSPFYRDHPLCIDWNIDGSQIKEHLNKVYPYLKGNVGIKIQREHVYFKKGITYGKRTDRFNAQVLPAGMIPSFEGIGLYPSDETNIWWLLSYLNTRVVAYFLNLTCGLHKNSVYVDRIPIPDFNEDDKSRLGSNAKELFYLVRSANCSNETSDFFISTIKGLGYHDSLNSYFAYFRKHQRESEMRAWKLTIENEQIISKHTQFGHSFKSELEKDQGILPSWSKDDFVENKPYPIQLSSNLKTRARPIFNRASQLPATDLSRAIFDLGLTVVEARYQLDTVNYLEESELIQDTIGIIQWAVGCSLGRWDIRYSTVDLPSPRLSDPFDPRPFCPPGMLIGPDGLPADQNNIVSEEWLRARPDVNTLPPKGALNKPNISDAEYPLKICWDGILVDDPGGIDGWLSNGTPQPNKDDIVRRTHKVLDLLWRDKVHELEQEVCDILGVLNLRDYFRKPVKFFQDHLKRYTKSHRKAPIYWPLSTSSGSYTIWIYYHRLNDQTLYAAVNKYVEPKINEVERGLGRIEDDLRAASGREGTRLRDRLNEAQTFLGELRDLREELLRIAALPYKPNLNDGVIINAAPLNGLFNLRSWANDTKKVWDKLKKGEYNWAHLAYTIWPDRVRDVCKTDRSIAIAHGLEDLCEVESSTSKKKGGRGRRKREIAR